MNDKVIFIVGPSFGGKTYLMNHIVESIDDVRLVNFELFYDLKHSITKCYDLFIDHIRTAVLAGEKVVAECTGHLLFDKPRIELIRSLAIVVAPSVTDHMRNYNKYMKSFGLRSTIKRSGGHGVGEMRNMFNTHLSHNRNKSIESLVAYNGTNETEVIQEIKYFFDGTHIPKSLNKQKPLFDSN